MKYSCILYKNTDQEYYSRWRRNQTLNPNSIINITQKIFLRYKIIVMCDPKASKNSWTVLQEE